MIFLLCGGIAIWKTRFAQAFLLRFPRHRGLAWLLTAIGIGWFGVLLYQGPWFARLEPFKGWLVVLIPVLIVLVCLFVDELLAPRALGGLFILLPQYLLDAGRWHESAFSLLTQAVAYAFVIAGVGLVLAPFGFRKGVEMISASPLRFRGVAIVSLLIGSILVVLGIGVY